MAKFKVGDRARVVYSRAHPERAGEVCTVVKESVLTWPESEAMDYGIRYDNIPDHVPTGYWCVYEDQLEPLLGSWEEIEAMTGWKRPQDTQQPLENANKTKLETII